MSLWEQYADATRNVEPKRREQLRSALEATLSRPRAAPPARTWSAGRYGALLAAAAAVFLLVWFGWPTLEGPVSGTVVVSTESQIHNVELPLDGKLVLAERTKAKITASDDAGALVELEHGGVTLDVNSGPGIRWRVRVREYEVEAVGTRFRVRETSGVPEVHVEEGVVRMTGPGLEAGVSIRAGESGPATPPAAETPIPVPAPPPAIVPVVEPPDEPPAPRPDRTKPRRPRWVDEFRQAVDSGDSKRAVAALPSGFPTGRERFGAADYVEAGNALSAMGEGRRGERSYEVACDKARRSGSCGIATYRLALSRAQAGDLGTAVDLADRYLREHRDGSLERAVLGRRMQWQWKLGRKSAAKADATTYLERWPKGSHAGAARRILD